MGWRELGMQQPTAEQLTGILAHFALLGVPGAVRPYGSGHINDTFLTQTEACPSGYVLQRVSSACFPQPEQVMDNVCGVTAYLREEILRAGGDPARETLTLIPTREGRRWYVDDAGDCWRVYLNIPNTRTYQLPESEEIFCQAGRAFGAFQMMLAEYPAQTLHETIPNFHHTPSRVAALQRALEEDRAGRAAQVQAEAAFALARAHQAGELTSLLAAGRLPLRVTHNDTKLNNVLMDVSSGAGVCVIDLDTVMPGLCAYDFGDAIRFGANTALEDERDLSQVRFSLPMFSAFTRGYLMEAGRALTAEEVRTLPLGAWTMTYECAIRFLTDYLNGDIYFKIACPDHNLVRARNQLKLLAEMEQQEAVMAEAVADAMEGIQ